MRIYATGFNAHNQIPVPFQDRSRLTKEAQSTSHAKAPQYLTSFTKVVQSAPPIEVLATFWSATIIKIGSELWHYGFRPEGSTDPGIISLPHSIEISDLERIFGDVSGVRGAISNGQLLLLRTSPLRFEFYEWPEGPWMEGIADEAVEIQDLAIAGNEEVCLSTRNVSDSAKAMYHFNVFPSFGSLLNGDAPKLFHQIKGPIRSLQAGATAFVALLFDGSLLTFGSPLQPALLARTPCADAPAAIPNPITFLGGISIAKVVVCEWLGAALSKERDLYIWGGRAGEIRKIASLPDADEEIRLVDIAEGVDIIDVALGMDHIIALTDECELWGCGNNEYGQLSLQDMDVGFVEDWRKLTISNKGNGEIVGLKAGGWSSWIRLAAPPGQAVKALDVRSDHETPR